METEGKLSLQEPKIYEAEDKAEAMWKYMHEDNPEWGRMFYPGGLNQYRKEGEITGWGFRIEELAPKVSPSNESWAYPLNP